MRYEIRYTPDDLPLATFCEERAAVRHAMRRAERTGQGPYLIYAVSDAGERYIGAAG
jgi:hypothetical protein